MSFERFIEFGLIQELVLYEPEQSHNVAKTTTTKNMSCAKGEGAVGPSTGWNYKIVAQEKT